MNIRNKKNIGILLAVIMVTSIFVGLAPSVLSWAPSKPGTTWGPALNITITSPANGTCISPTEVINLTWVKNGTTDPMVLYGYVRVAIMDCEAECIEVDHYKACGGGCAHYEMNFSEYPWNTYTVPNCDYMCIYVWNNTADKWGLPDTSDFRNGTMIKMDNIEPCIKPVDPIAGEWYNCTKDIQLNVSACDNCCGLLNVTANTTAIASAVTGSGSNGTLAVTKFTNTSISAGTICGYPEECKGSYWVYDIPYTLLKTSCPAGGIVDIRVTARDNATANNTAETTLKLGVDCDNPDRVGDPSAVGTPGAITVTWPTGVDACSGVQYYDIQARNLNASDWFYVDRTTSTTYDYTGASTNASYCKYYEFQMSAVDNAFNIGPWSNATEPQHLKQGPAADIDLVVPDEAEGCGCKNYTLKATVKDAYEVAIGDIEVEFNTTDGQVCPTKAKTKGDSPYAATVDYTTPKVVLKPYNVTICAWVCSNTSIIECKNITIIPKQAEKAIITADPEMITAGAGEINKSTITVQLVDRLGNPVAGSGNMDVEVTTTAGTFEATGTDTDSGKMVNGTFTTTLVSDTTPTLAIVSANVGNLYFPETTVAFAGYGSYDILLYKGWNLISLPLVPDNADAGDVLADIANELIEAWTYDGCEDEWTSGKFVPPAAWTGDLETMEVERGYWLEMNESATLTVTGYTMMPGNVPPPTLDVCEGWNLVGYYAIPPDKVIIAKVYFIEVIVSYVVLGFDGASQGWVTVDEGDNLYSGKGYWMNAEKDGEITPQEWV